MKATYSVRSVETEAPLRAVVPDIEVEEMEGFYELGMHRRALPLARRIISRPKLTAEAFGRTVILIESCAGKLNSWIEPVESAWNRLSPRARRRARPQLLGFHYATEKLDRALPLATVHPRDASDLMFSLATFMHHRQEREARRLVTKALRWFGSLEDSLQQAMLCRAIAHYHLGRKEWDLALQATRAMPSHLAFVAEQHHDMAAAVRGSAEEALSRLEKLANLDLSVSQSGLDATLTAQARCRLTRLRKSLAWVNAK